MQQSIGARVLNRFWAGEVGGIGAGGKRALARANKALKTIYRKVWIKQNPCTLYWGTLRVAASYLRDRRGGGAGARQAKQDSATRLLALLAAVAPYELAARLAALLLGVTISERHGCLAVGAAVGPSSGQLQ